MTTIIFIVIIAIVVAVGAWYYKTAVLDKASDSGVTTSRNDNATKELSEEEKIEAAITDSVESIKNQAEASESDLDSVDNSTVAAQAVTVPTQLARVQSGIDAKLRCETVKSFGIDSAKAITDERKIMEESFGLSLNLLKAKWRVQDATSEASRKAAESLFLSLLDLYEATHAGTAKKVTAIDQYRSDELIAFGLFHDDYDASQTSYRENMLTLIKSHHSSLRTLVDTFTSDIQTAVTKAQKICSDTEILLPLADEVIQARRSFADETTKTSSVAHVNAVQLVKTRNFEILRQIVVLHEKAHELQVAMTNVPRS